ncbi:MAG TPA: Gfo/Idh/MocA family oxidoreductase [Abditibacteriaceae bacterium]|jgi:predicted dehydrogenase
MARTYRVGVASMVHDHVWGELNHWAKMPNVEVVAAGDVNADLRERIQSKFNVPKVYDSWQEMIANEELDIVQAASENNVAADIVEASAAKGIHVISEKPMSATLDQANRMVRATQTAGTQLMINWPTAWNPAIQELERRILAGDIGQLFYFKQRSAHNGPKEIGCDPHFWGWLYDEEKNGAGALMDYCGYSADMCARFLGLPQQVTGFRSVFVKDYPIPDDNAIIMMKYAHAFGVAEASWTQTVGYATNNPVAYGTGGSLAVAGDKLILQTPGNVETITPQALQSPRSNGPEYFIHCLESGEPIEGFCSMQVSRDAQEILEAGKRAADTGQTMNLPLP